MQVQREPLGSFLPSADIPLSCIPHDFLPDTLHLLPPRPIFPLYPVPHAFLPDTGASEEELAALPSATCGHRAGSTQINDRIHDRIHSSLAEDALIDLRDASSARFLSAEPSVLDPGVGTRSDGFQAAAIPHDDDGGIGSASALVPALLPVIVPLAGEPCGICLAEFEAGEALKSADGVHFFHPGCIFEWLRIRAACPTCRQPLASRVGV